MRSSSCVSAHTLVMACVFAGVLTACGGAASSGVAKVAEAERTRSTLADKDVAKLAPQAFAEAEQALAAAKQAERAGDTTSAELQKLGIVEEVGQPTVFGPTTHHKCCEPRVKNIHRIADLVRGSVIQPGETFSINRTVGVRTAAKGFVVAGAIVAKLVRDQIDTGREAFSTRELRLAGGDLRLPEVQDNLGVRLLLLERRLAERDFGLRIERAGRGQYRLIASGRLNLVTEA